MNNESIEDLQLDGLRLIQNKLGYCFTSDSVILANFIKCKPEDKVLEIGTGSGVISILVSHKNNNANIIAVEIQKSLSELARRNVELNKKQDLIKIVNQDINDFCNENNLSSYDVVFSNPPYYDIKSVIVGGNEEKQICRYEKKMNLKQLVSISNKLLKNKGKFYIVYPANRVADLVYELRLNMLEPKLMFFTQPSISSSPVLVLVMAVKNANPGLKVLPTLITNDKDGNYIQQIKNNYRE